MFATSSTYRFACNTLLITTVLCLQTAILAGCSGEGVESQPQVDRHYRDGMVLVASKGNCFFMGNEANAQLTPAAIAHSVCFTYDFWMDTTEVTQKDYDSIMRTGSVQYAGPPWKSDFGLGDDFPARNVSWYDAVLYCNARSRLMGYDTVYTYISAVSTPTVCCSLSGLTIDYKKSGFRLATEAEWEYASRGGTKTEYYWADKNAFDYAWYSVNSSSATHAVAQKIPNDFGLYDMCGNVAEWCNDWYATDYYTKSPTVDPCGPELGTNRVRRGGSWISDKLTLGSATRGSSVPLIQSAAIGFRVVLPLVE